MYEKSRISSLYLPWLTNCLSWFSTISRHTISVYWSSMPFPVTMRIFCSSVAMMSRSPLLRSFFPIWFSLKSFSQIFDSSFHRRCGKSTTTICSPVFLSCSAKSSLRREECSSSSTPEKSLTYFSSRGISSGFIEYTYSARLYHIRIMKNLQKTWAFSPFPQRIGAFEFS